MITGLDLAKVMPAVSIKIQPHRILSKLNENYIGGKWNQFDNRVNLSTAIRWIAAIGLILVGIGFALLLVFGGAFSTVACLEIPPDWIYYILLGTGLITVAGSAVPAVMLIRKAKPVRIVLMLVLGLILSCTGYVTYLTLLGNNC